MKRRKVIFGHRNPDTLMAMADLAHTWKSQGRDQEAIGLTEGHPHLMDSSAAVESWLAMNVNDSAGRQPPSKSPHDTPENKHESYPLRHPDFHV
jgi:hypothetical protein